MIDMFSQIFRFRVVALISLCGAMVSIAATKNEPGPRLMPGLGDVHHPVSTKNREAQQFFDQGMKLVYGFNHDEARRSFQRAAGLDPKLAMAWWGVALTLGPNYNLPVDLEREKAGYDAVQRAVSLQENASEPERAYINALTVRYSNDPHVDLHALDRAYKEAMGKLAARYPDDLDAVTLYAESAMNLNPWKLWTADRKFLGETQEQGIYRMMYYSHNLHFLAFASCMNGNFAGAKDAAAKLVANVAPGVKAMPMLEGFLPTPIVVLFAFEHWNDLLKLPAPDPSFVTTNAVWHSLRGVAFANTGKTAEAEQEQKQFRELAAKIPPEQMYDMLNNVGAVFKIHEHLLAAEIARSRHDDKAAIDSLKQAIAAEDALNYSEPPPWYPPVRPILGRVLLKNKDFAEAEKIFRADLEKHPRNARALAGLRDCLNAQGRKYDADQIDQQFHAAWKVAAATNAAASKR